MNLSEQILNIVKSFKSLILPDIPLLTHSIVGPEKKLEKLIKSLKINHIIDFIKKESFTMSIPSLFTTPYSTNEMPQADASAWTPPMQEENQNRPLTGYLSPERVEDRKQRRIKKVNEFVPNAHLGLHSTEETEEYKRKFDSVILPGGGVRLPGYSPSNIDIHDESLPEIVDWNSFAVRANQYLAVGALLPVVGTITGTAKIALSIIFCVGITVSYACSKNRTEDEKAEFHKRFKYCLTSMKDGLLEAIPFVGTVFAMHHILRDEYFS